MPELADGSVIGNRRNRRLLLLLRLRRWCVFLVVPDDPLRGADLEDRALGATYCQCNRTKRHDKSPIKFKRGRRPTRSEGFAGGQDGPGRAARRRDRPWPLARKVTDQERCVERQSSSNCNPSPARCGSTTREYEPDRARNPARTIDGLRYRAQGQVPRERRQRSSRPGALRHPERHRPLACPPTRWFNGPRQTRCALRAGARRAGSRRRSASSSPTTG